MQQNQTYLKFKKLIKEKFTHFFVANSDKNEVNKKKQNRLAWLFGGIIIILLIIIFKGSGQKAKFEKENLPEKQAFEVEQLTQGASHEDKWVKREGKQVQAVKERQEAAEKQTKMLTENLDKVKISKEDVKELLNIQRQELQAEFDKKILSETEKLKKDQENKAEASGNIGYAEIPKKTSYQFGKYIPAGSHAKAVLISGVDAGIGITSEADPRQILMRVTGTVTSAGFGAKNLTSNALVGCVIQGQAIGD